MDDHVLLGALPFKSDVKKLAELGVKAVVNTCEEYAGPSTAYALHNIEQLRVPIIDYSPPTLSQIVKAVDFIDAQSSKNNIVYVHCKAGQGRSATIVLCWIMKNQQIGPEEALRYLISKRPQVNRHLHERDSVKQYANNLLGHTKNRSEMR